MYWCQCKACFARGLKKGNCKFWSHVECSGRKTNYFFHFWSYYSLSRAQGFNSNFPTSIFVAFGSPPFATVINTYIYPTLTWTRTIPTGIHMHIQVKIFGIRAKLVSDRAGVQSFIVFCCAEYDVAYSCHNVTRLYFIYFQRSTESIWKEKLRKKFFWVN